MLAIGFARAGGVGLFVQMRARVSVRQKRCEIGELSKVKWGKRSSQQTAIGSKIEE